MAQKNDTITLLFALVITGAIIGLASWWILSRLGINTINPIQNNSNNPNSHPKTFAEVPNIPSGLFNYGGSTTFAPIRAIVDQSIQTVFPDFKLRYTDPIIGAPGSGTGIKMLLGNQLAFSQSSRSLEEKEYQTAQAQNFTLKEIPVAIDGIAIAVNPNLNIAGLTVAQLQNIYTGKITNWSQVGGPNLTITPYSRSKEAGGTVEFFIKNVLEAQELGSNIAFVRDTTQGLREVGKNLGGIYYASAPEVIPQCKIKPLPLGKKTGEWITPYQEPYIPSSQCPQKRNRINQAAFQSGAYPITRRLFIIVKQNGQIDEQAGLAYANLLLTDQGQDLITQAGFVSLR